MALLIILIGAIWLTQSLRFIEVIVNHNVDLSGYFSLIVYLIPDLVALMIPICLLVSGLHVFYKMKSDHELHVMRALGLSNLYISSPFILLGILFTFLAYWINIFVMPYSFKKFRDQEYAIRNQFSSALIREGSFNFLKGMTVFIKERTNDGQLKDIFIFKPASQKGEQEKTLTILAKSGFLQKVNDQYVMVLQHGTRQEKNVNSNEISFFAFEEFVYDFSKALQKQEERSVKPYEKSLTELFDTSHTNYDTKTLGRMRTEAHQRLITPWLALLDILVVCAFMLRQSMQRKRGRVVIAAAATTSLVMHISIVALLNLSTEHPKLLYILYGTLPLLALSLLLLLEWKRVVLWWNKS